MEEDFALLRKMLAVQEHEKMLTIARLYNNATKALESIQKHLDKVFPNWRNYPEFDVWK